MKGLLALVLSGSLAVAQTPAEPSPATPAPTKDALRTAQRAQSMREQIGSGRPQQLHVRVAVRLKNGNRLLGVVKDGMLIERVDGLRFVEAQADDAGAGVRLWYSAGANSYVFVPFGQFQEYEVLQRLSQKQLATLEQEMQMRQRAAEERAAASAPAAAEPPSAPGGEPAPAVESEPAPAPAVLAKKAKGKGGKSATGEGAESPAGELDQQRAWVGLLQEYPPSAGWNKARRDEIARKFAVVGVPPTPAEKRFVDQFDQWSLACVHFQVKTEPQPATEEPAAETKKSRRNR